MTRSICTSEPLQASTSVSTGFTFTGHSSHIFRVAPYMLCLAQGGRRRRLTGSRPLVSLRLGGYNPSDSHAMCTPWSVFQDGRLTIARHSTVRRGSIGTWTTTPDRSGRISKALFSPSERKHAVHRHSTKAHARDTSNPQPLSQQRFHFCFNPFCMVAFHLSLAVLVCYRSCHHI